MTDTTSGALPGLRAGSFTVRPAGPRTGFSTKNLLGMTAAGEFRDFRVGPLPGREAAARERPAGSRRSSPALIVRTWRHRPGRGPACPDKETP
jgi:hypothetical protein